jgi:hypothetical protein
MNIRLCLTLLLAGAGLSGLAGQDQPSPSAAPKLVVMVVVDQMRTDYLENGRAQFKSGLKRLLSEGAWFRRAAYPYLNTVTCAGHSTIGTGAFPYRHGMVLNRWWDRAGQRTRSCTDDAAVANIGYLEPSAARDSASSLVLPTLAEQLRATAAGRSAVFSLKARSSISLSGKGAATVIWQDRTNWVTSSAFAAAPLDWVKAYVTAHPVSADRGRVWERLLPAADYRGEDAAAGERFPTGWSASFPHPIGTPEAPLDAQWQRTPFADEYLARFAVQAVDSLQLGRGRGTDFLGVSFSTLDLVGHQFGPHSHEVQDIVLRLDATLGGLLDALDARLGKAGYVLALSSDHGVSTLTERTGAGRHLSAEITAAVDKALEPILGNGKHVAHTEYTDIYFAAGVNERVKSAPKAWPAVREALLALPGIAHVFRGEEVGTAEARWSSDPAMRAAALSYFPGRSGDVIIVPKEHWLLSTAAATHGTLYPYDQQVPVIFFGAGVTPELSDRAASPADIAPTLAVLARVPFSPQDGKPLLTASAVGSR